MCMPKTDMACWVRNMKIGRRTQWQWFLGFTALGLNAPVVFTPSYLASALRAKGREQVAEWPQGTEAEWRRRRIGADADACASADGWLGSCVLSFLQPLAVQSNYKCSEFLSKYRLPRVPSIRRHPAPPWTGLVRASRHIASRTSALGFCMR